MNRKTLYYAYIDITKQKGDIEYIEKFIGDK
jgi:hypothetical protein